jgi:hypothetical protein
MSGVDDAMAWAYGVAHDIKKRLRLAPCRHGFATVADRHDTVCNSLAGGIAATIVGHGINVPPAPAPGTATAKGTT